MKLYKIRQTTDKQMRLNSKHSSNQHTRKQKSTVGAFAKH